MNLTRVAMVCAAMLCWALAPHVFAQGGPCTEDAKKFCADQPPGGGGRLKCFQAHIGELSPACKQHLEAMKAKGRPQRRQQALARLKACKADVEKFCADTKRGQGQILQCLKSHSAELSAACKQQIESAPQPKK